MVTVEEMLDMADGDVARLREKVRRWRRRWMLGTLSTSGVGDLYQRTASENAALASKLLDAERRVKSWSLGGGNVEGVRGEPARLLQTRS